MPSDVTSFNWHSASPRMRHIMAGLLVMASVWTAMMANSALMQIIALVFALGAIGVLIDQETHINMKALTVSRTGHLFGRYQLWHSAKPLHDFAAVGFQRFRGSPHSPNDIVYVGLQRHTGSLLTLRYFTIRRGQPSPEANAFGHDLAETVHMELREEKI